MLIKGLPDQFLAYLGLTAPVVAKRDPALVHDGIPLLGCMDCEPDSVQFLGRCSKWIVDL